MAEDLPSEYDLIVLGTGKLKRFQSSFDSITVISKMNPF